jgi:hypothetical protein
MAQFSNSISRLLDGNTLSFCSLFIRTGQVRLQVTVSQSVCLGVEPPWPDISYVMKVTVLSIGGALSDERSENTTLRKLDLLPSSGEGGDIYSVIFSF